MRPWVKYFFLLIYDLIFKHIKIYFHSCLNQSFSELLYIVQHVKFLPSSGIQLSSPDLLPKESRMSGGSRYLTLSSFLANLSSRVEYEYDEWALISVTKATQKLIKTILSLLPEISIFYCLRVVLILLCSIGKICMNLFNLHQHTIFCVTKIDFSL